MKKFLHAVRKILCCLLFLTLTGGLLAYVNVVLTAKQTARQLTPMAMYHDFYSMEENTVDVIFLGSSHCYSAFSPQYLYNEYGIRSYNLGSSQQSMTVAYYWLKEALQTQSPKAVVLDTCTFFQWFNDNNTNSQEPFVRKAMDFMRWGPNKLEAIWELHRLEPEEFPLESFFLPNIRYHSRWKELTAEDVHFTDTFITGQSKGYSGMYIRRGHQSFEAHYDGESDKSEPLYAPQLPYIHKLIDLCRDKGIDLILVRTPYNFAYTPTYNALRDFAAETGLPLYDFNGKEMYEKSGFDFGMDCDDNNHCNIWGAQKMTAFIGKLLTEEYGFTPVKDRQYEDTRQYYEESLEDAELRDIEDLKSYLPLLDRDRFVILAAVDKSVMKEASEEVAGTLEEYGYDLSDGYEVLVSGERRDALKGKFRDEKENYQISVKWDELSIRIGGEEMLYSEDDINFVVYDLNHLTVVDRVTFSAKNGSVTAHGDIY